MKRTFHILTPRDLPRTLSIVIPLYNEEDVLPLLIERLRSLMADLPCPVEIILVNDGSSDRTIAILHEVSREDTRFKVLGLARNFGHQLAATAGLDAARGDAVVLMDADLQDPPKLVGEMIVEYRKGYDVVYALRVKREGDTVFKRFSAWLFYRMMRALVYKDLPADVGDYRLISRRCLDALSSMRETHRFLRGMVSWVGFPQTAVPFVRAHRAAGQTKYPLSKMLRFAWTAAVSFSPLPLRLSLIVGGSLFVIGFLYTLYAIGRLLLGYYLVPGWTSVIILNCLTGGTILLGIGVLGEYVARIFEEIKARPLYIVSDTLNMGDTLASQESRPPIEQQFHGR
jgi:dolichol-phosphate mannosyltransferase